jgi:hypothetical protein
MQILKLKNIVLHVSGLLFMCCMAQYTGTVNLLFYINTGTKMSINYGN